MNLYSPWYAASFCYSSFRPSSDIQLFWFYLCWTVQLCDTSISSFVSVSVPNLPRKPSSIRLYTCVKSLMDSGTQITFDPPADQNTGAEWNGDAKMWLLGITCERILLDVTDVWFGFGGIERTPNLTSNAWSPEREI